MDDSRVGRRSSNGLFASALACAVLIGVACGGSSSNGVGAGPGDAGGAGEGGASTYTLDDVCERSGPVLCDMRKSCCTAGSGFDEAGCLAHAKAECDKDVAEARAGREDFHPERIDGCIPKLRAILSTCTSTFEVLQGALRDLASCQIFTGRGATGTPCTTSSQCGVSASADAFSSCDDTTHTCHTIQILSEGSACSLGDDVSAICDKGLYCDVSVTSDGGLGAGTCKRATPLNATCTKALECGLGNYCSSATKMCTPGKGSDAPCQDALECASITCVKASGATSGSCKPLDPLSKPEECKGP